MLRWLKKKHQQYLERVRDPILADRSLDLMAGMFWFCIAAWGVSTTIAGLPTIGRAAGPGGEILWGGYLGIVCTVAAVAAFSTFYITPNIEHRIVRKRIEMVAGSLAGGGIAVYPVLVLIDIAGGDTTRVSTFFIAVSYLVVPTWRVRHLYHRIRKLREVASLHTGQVTL